MVNNQTNQAWEHECIIPLQPKKTIQLDLSLLTQSTSKPGTKQSGISSTKQYEKIKNSYANACTGASLPTIAKFTEIQGHNIYHCKLIGTSMSFFTWK